MPAPSRFLRQQQVKYSTCWYCWQCSDQGDGSSKGGTVLRKRGRFSGRRDGSPEQEQLPRNGDKLSGILHHQYTLCRLLLSVQLRQFSDSLAFRCFCSDDQLAWRYDTGNKKKQRIREIRVFFVSYKMYLAAGEGFEPSQTDPESVVLPLHNPAISATVVIIAHCPWVMQEFLRTILQHRAAVV